MGLNLNKNGDYDYLKSEGDEYNKRIIQTDCYTNDVTSINEWDIVSRKQLMVVDKNTNIKANSHTKKWNDSSPSELIKPNNK